MSDPEPRSPVSRAGDPPPSAPNPAEVCPNCGGTLDPRQCKVFCARCGLLVYNCSEF